MTDTTKTEAPQVSEKRAPVQGYPGGIPWAIHLEAYEVYCRRWGAQPALIDLEGRNCRGGFSTGELDDFIPGWRDRVAEFGKLKTEVQQLRSERDRLAAECEALRAALSAILKSPTGCQFCDYGKPRLSIRTGSPCEHDEGCGFVLAHAAMGGKE